MEGAAEAAAAYDPAAWKDLFVAVAGASAALLGLLFVAVSINLEAILKYKGLPERALETLLLLLSVLVVAIMGLAPAQSNTAFGIEVLVLGLVMGTIAVKLPIYAADETGHEPIRWKLSRWSVRAFSIVPFLVAGLSLLLEGGGGLYWLLAGIVFATCGAVASAWVLMVEILR
jgi:modulator of FtsH protease